MKKKILLFLIIAVCMSIAPDSFAMNESRIQIYVAPYGNDMADGNIDSPLRTLDGAKQRVRKLKSGSVGVDVIFREGEYRFNKGVEFTEEDAGTDGNPIVYKAYDGEQVTFKGSVQLDMTKGTAVTDEKILNRMYENVRNKVIQVDLLEQGFPYVIEKPNKMYHNSDFYPETGCEYVNLYLNGKEQPIAQWPNGTDRFSRWSDVVKHGSNGQNGSDSILAYTETNPDRWKEAKYAWVCAYFEMDYRMSRYPLLGVNVNDRTITVGKGNPQNTASQRWKGMNLLEEIDMPGEWFVDVDTMILYYYPSYSLKDSAVEMSALTDNMVMFRNTQYIDFEGIDFTQSRKEIIYLNNVNNINIRKCNFYNIDKVAIFGEGTTYAQKDNYWYQKSYIDGVYNSVIEDCRFYGIGGSCIDITGGNVDTLTDSGVIIRNNVFFDFADKNKNDSGIVVHGCGVSILNNHIAYSPFHAIDYWNNNHKIKNNEVYNVSRISNDVGAIYCGRNFTSRGDEVEYNYIHDAKIYDPNGLMTSDFYIAVYLDDSISGQRVNHNIFYNVRTACRNCGQDNHINYNTIINTWNDAIMLTNAYENDNRYNSQWKQQAESIPNFNLYEKTYGLMNLGLTPKWRKLNAWVQTKENLMVNSKEMSVAPSATMYGVVENNVQVESCDDFVDPENQDFRLKSGSKTAKLMPNILSEDNFDIEDIGVQTMKNEFGGERSSFRQIYPENGQASVNPDKITFQWEKSYGANNYRLVIAEDRELTKLVYDKTTPEILADVDCLEKDKTYYWKVYAENISREFGNEWESSSEVFSLKTSDYIPEKTAELSEAVKKAKVDITSVNEGENTGEYKIGTVDGMNNLIVEAEKIMKANSGKYTQAKIDSLANTIESYLSDNLIMQRGYMNFGKYLTDPNKWVNGKNDVTETKNDTTVFAPITTSKSTGVANIEKFSGNCILKFKAKIDVTTWLGIGLTTSPKTDLWSTNNGKNKGYFFAIKPKIVEFQRNTGEKNSMMEIKDLAIANDGNFHDFEIAAIQLNGGTLAYLKIDDTVYYDYLDTAEDRITGDLQFSVYFGTNTRVEFAQSDDIPEVTVYDELIQSYKNEITEMAYSMYDGKGENLIIMRIDCGAIATKNGVLDIAEAPPIIRNSKTLIPLRSVAESFNAEVIWEDNTATIKLGDKEIKFVPNESTYTVNGQIKELAQPAEIVNDRVMVPVRDLAESLGKELIWHEQNRLVIIGDALNIVVMNEQPMLKKTGEALLNYKSDSE